VITGPCPIASDGALLKAIQTHMDQLRAAALPTVAATATPMTLRTFIGNLFPCGR
jgi:hypothetical protein